MAGLLPILLAQLGDGRGRAQLTATLADKDFGWHKHIRAALAALDARGPQT
jgi:hypothetical protein